MAMARLERRLESVLAREHNEGLYSRMETNITQKMEAGMKQQMLRLEAGKTEQTEAMLASLSSTLVKRLDQIVTGELKRNLTEVVNRALEGVKSQMEREVSNKLQGLEIHLEDGKYFFNSILKLYLKTLINPHTREVLARNVTQAVISALQSSITEGYKTAFHQQTIGFERALQTMLKQVAEQFNRGTKDYEMILTKWLEVVERQEVSEILSPVLGRVEAQLQEVKEGMTKLVQSVGGLSRQLETSRAGVSGEQVRDIVRRELEGAINNTHSLSATPQPDVKSITMRQAIQVISMRYNLLKC